MMRILILIIMLLPCSLGMYASAIDSLLSVLDKTIVMRRQYEEEKERYISLIKDELKQGRLTDMERYLIQNRLFAEYNSYISDSALQTTYVDIIGYQLFVVNTVEKWMCFLLAYGRKPRFNVFNLILQEKCEFEVAK